MKTCERVRSAHLVGPNFRHEYLRDALLQFEFERQSGGAPFDEPRHEPLDRFGREHDVVRIAVRFADGQKAAEREPIEEFAEGIEAVFVLAGVVSRHLVRQFEEIRVGVPVSSST